MESGAHCFRAPECLATRDVGVERARFIAAWCIGVIFPRFPTVDRAALISLRALPLEAGSQLSIPITGNAGHMPKVGAVHIQIGCAPVMAVEHVEELRPQTEGVAPFVRAHSTAFGDV